MKGPLPPVQQSGQTVTSGGTSTRHPIDRTQTIVNWGGGGKYASPQFNAPVGTFANQSATDKGLNALGALEGDPGEL